MKRPPYLEEQRLLESAGNELAARGEELLDQQQLLEEKIAAFMADAEAQIAAADAQFAEQGIALENGRLKLASAFSQLEDGQIQINNGWSELESQRVSGEQALGKLGRKSSRAKRLIRKVWSLLQPNASMQKSK